MSRPEFDWGPPEPAPLGRPGRSPIVSVTFDARIAAALLGAVLMVVGSIGPWLTAFGLISVDGTAGDGKITLVCGVVVALATVTAQRGSSIGIVAALGALIGLGIAVRDLTHITSLLSGTSGLAHPGWGLYAVVVGSAMAIVALVSARRTLGRPANR